LIKAVKHIFNIQGTGLFAWFFVLYAILGFATLHRYGVHYDELTQRSIGIENARYIAGWGKFEDVQQHKYFGPLFETPAYLLEQLVFTQPMQTKLLLRRALLFAVFLLSVWGIFRIGKHLFQHRYTAEIVAIVYACWPRLFAEAHYNSKDVFFLCMGVFVLWALASATYKGKFPWAACMLAGMASTVRIAGLFYLIPVLWVLMHYRFQFKRVYALLLGIIVFIAAWYIVYPAVWKTPLQSFIGILRYANENPWPSPTILAGKTMMPGNVPAYYAFLWMLVTLPVVYIILFFMGIKQAIVKFRQSSVIQYVVILLLITIIYIIINKPTLYNGWRHVYYLYIPTILIAGLTVDSVLGRINIKKTVLLFILFPIFLVYNLKYDFVYFNSLKNFWRPGSFSMDYWGISTRDALMSCKSNEKYRVYAFTETVWLNKQILGNAALNIQEVKSADSADFVLVLNREGKLDHYQLPVFAKDVYNGDTLWMLYDRRSENIYSR
jgi:hypothetical protein